MSRCIVGRVGAQSVTVKLQTTTIKRCCLREIRVTRFFQKKSSTTTNITMPLLTLKIKAITSALPAEQFSKAYPMKLPLEHIQNKKRAVAIGVIAVVILAIIIALCATQCSANTASTSASSAASTSASTSKSASASSSSSASVAASDSTSKETEAGEETTSSESSASQSQNQNSSSASDSSSDSNTSSYSGSGDTNQSENSEQTHVHDWVWVSNVVTVVDRDAYDEFVRWATWCNKCNCEVDNEHTWDMMEKGEYGHSLFSKEIYEHHDAVTHTEDQGYYQCSSCGATQ